MSDDLMKRAQEAAERHITEPRLLPEGDALALEIEAHHAVD